MLQGDSQTRQIREEQCHVESCQDSGQKIKMHKSVQNAIWAEFSAAEGFQLSALRNGGWLAM